MPRRKPRMTAAQKKALWALIITTAGGIVIAAIKVVPDIYAGIPKVSDPVSASPVATPVSSPASSESTTVNTAGTNSPVITGNNNSIVLEDQHSGKIAAILDERLPEEDSIFVNLSQPIDEQVRLYAGDRVTVYGPFIKAVNFGLGWQNNDPDKPREHIVAGYEGEPVIPEFRGTGDCKVHVQFTKYRDRKRYPEPTSSKPSEPRKKS